MGMTESVVRSSLSAEGFTLIEMIASLAIVAMLAAVAGIGLVQLTEGFILSRTGAETAQKAQMAMMRMVKEFNHIVDVQAGSSLSLRFDSYHADDPLDPIHAYTITWNGTAGDPLLLTCLDCPGGPLSAPLVDQVVSFGLAYVYYDAAGNLTTAATRTAEWAAAFASPVRQTGLRVDLQLQNPDADHLATTVFLGKHD
jgi:prepilin-type N-terminal cleavage/methylation domain-containing protein